MRSKNVYEAVDALAPFRLSKEYCERYGFHDNSGILVDQGEEVTGVLCALDLSARAVEAAKAAGANVIVTHHPAIFYPVSSLKAEDPVLMAARAGISVISAHLNLDAAPGGIDESLMQGLGGSACTVMHPLTGGGYGRVYEVPQQTLAAFVAQTKARFQTQRVVVYGDRPVRKVASFCGAGLDESTVCFAAEHGADTFVSADGKHHLVAALIERGINLVLLTHYASEQYGFLRFAEALKQKIKGVRVFTDERLM